jgi:response regulator RpfG family c-di-GMP phosphodiesterase
MKRKIVVADRDGSLQHAFKTIFSREHYEIIYASNGKEVEKVAEKMNQDVYIVNVNLPKINGIEVYKKLQRQRLLESASFFFLKDEADGTELLGYQADGVIEKPINFFRIYETITREDDVIELTDLVEERKEPSGRQIRDVPGPDEGLTIPRRQVRDVLKWEFEPPSGRTGSETDNQARPQGEAPSETIEALKESVKKEVKLHDVLGNKLRDAMESVSGGPASALRVQEVENPVEVSEPESELEAQFKVVLNQAMEEAANKLSARLAPILTQYVEDYVKQMLLEIAEKVIREEIDKLLKESTS